MTALVARGHDWLWDCLLAIVIIAVVMLTGMALAAGLAAITLAVIG